MEAQGDPPLESHLIACVQESLALYMHDNAIFLAERLVAEFPSEAGGLLSWAAGDPFRRAPAPACVYTSSAAPPGVAGQCLSPGNLLFPGQPGIQGIPPS